MLTTLYFGILLGILAFTLFIHLQIAARSGWPRHELWFLGTVLAVLVYDLLTWIEYGTADPALYFDLCRVQAIAGALFFACLLEFIVGYAGGRTGSLERLYELAFFGFSLWRALDPLTGLYTRVRGMETHRLPWGEEIYLVDGEPTLVYLVLLALVIAGLGFCVRALLRMRGAEERRMARFLGFGLGAILAGIVFDILVSAGLVHWLYLTETGYVGLAVVTSFGLTDEVIKLAELRKALVRSLGEKDVLIRELSHRVNNNLAVLSGLVRLQLGGEEEPRARRHLAAILGRVQSMATVHDLVRERDGLASVELAGFLGEIVAFARQTHDGPEIRVELDISPRDASLPLDLAVPLGLMANEIVCNSLLHAWAPDYAGERRVVFTGRMGAAGGKRRLELAIADNGRGWTQAEGKGVAPHGRTGGLGLQLLEALAEQLGAELGRGEGEGVRWTIAFDLQPAAKEATTGS